jgi:hypothetical protein
MFRSAILAAVLVAMHGSAAAQSLAPEQIAALGRPAVVLIKTFDASGGNLGSGSGFFVRTDGTFVTNLHVIEGAARLSITLHSGEVYDNVFYLASDPRRDLAALRVPLDDSPTLTLSADPVVVGERVYVLGNPLGLQGTFSDGLVSALRMVDGVELIQMSAPISPGSSGGPILNARGVVVGIATSSLIEGQLLNLAVPARSARSMLAIAEPPRRFASGVAPAVTGPLRQDRRPAPSRAPGSPSPREGLDAYEQQVIDYLAESYDQAIEYGFALGEAKGGSLRQGSSEVHKITFRAGKTYLINGACDDDCLDLDLILRRAGSTTHIDRDIDLDSFPAILYTPSRTEALEVVVRMVSCSENPCRYGVAVFER